MTDISIRVLLLLSCGLAETHTTINATVKMPAASGGTLRKELSLDQEGLTILQWQSANMICYYRYGIVIKDGSYSIMSSSGSAAG